MAGVELELGLDWLSTLLCVPVLGEVPLDHAENLGWELGKRRRALAEMHSNVSVPRFCKFVLTDTAAAVTLAVGETTESLLGTYWAKCFVLHLT